MCGKGGAVLPNRLLPWRLALTPALSSCFFLPFPSFYNFGDGSFSPTRLTMGVSGAFDVEVADIDSGELEAQAVGSRSVGTAVQRGPWGGECSPLFSALFLVPASS